MNKKRRINKSECVKIFRENYDDNLTLEENRIKLNNAGLSISNKSVLNWVDKLFGKTKMIRVPISMVDKVRELIEKEKGKGDNDEC